MITPLFIQQQPYLKKRYLLGECREGEGCTRSEKLKKSAPPSEINFANSVLIDIVNSGREKFGLKHFKKFF